MSLLILVCLKHKVGHHIDCEATFEADIVNTTSSFKVEIFLDIFSWY